MFAFPITLSCFQSRSAVPNSLNRQPSLPSIIARPTLTPSIIAIRQFFPSLPGYLLFLPSLPAWASFNHCQAKLSSFHHCQAVSRKGFLSSIIASLGFFIQSLPCIINNVCYAFHHCQTIFCLLYHCHTWFYSIIERMGCLD